MEVNQSLFFCLKDPYTSITNTTKCYQKLHNNFEEDAQTSSGKIFFDNRNESISLIVY